MLGRAKNILSLYQKILPAIFAAGFFCLLLIPVGVRAEAGDIITDQSQESFSMMLFVGKESRQWVIQSWTAGQDNFAGIKLYGDRIDLPWNFPFVVLCHGEPVFNGLGDLPVSNSTNFCGESAEIFGLFSVSALEIPYGVPSWFDLKVSEAINCLNPVSLDRISCPDSFDTIIGDKYFVKINFSPSYYYKAQLGLSEEDVYVGGTGYYLNSEHDYLRDVGDWAFATLSVESDELDPVIIIPGIMGSWNFGYGWELDPILNTYDDLWSALELAGYVAGESLFAFPYNWRLSNVYNAELLKQKIDEIKELSGQDKVDIIAHSMGGLIARSYVEIGDYQDDVDQLIFLAVPHLGAPKSYLMWEAGEIGDKPLDVFKERLLRLEAEFNGYSSAFDYVRNLPMKSVEELLPIYNYLVPNGEDEFLTYPQDYPQNSFLEILNNGYNLANLERVETINIVADDGSDDTISGFKIINREFADGEWEHGYPINYDSLFSESGVLYSSGDGTVPSQSNVEFSANQSFFLNSSHGRVVTDAQQDIIEILTGNRPTEEVRNNIFSKYLLIRIFSPADFMVIDPAGNRLGRDIVSGGVISEIVNGFYSGEAGYPEFAVIPDPILGDYRVELLGTGEGDYRLSVSYIDKNSAQDSDYLGLISGDEDRQFYFSLDLDDEAVLLPLKPEIENVDDLIKVLEDYYQQGLIKRFGLLRSLISRLLSGRWNRGQLIQLERIINLIFNDDKNLPIYGIIKNNLYNLKK